MITTRPDNSDPNKPKLIADIDNGDLQGLDRIMEKYGFVDYQAALRFAMVVLLDAEDNKVYVKKDGSTTVLQPNDKLINRSVVAEEEAE
jgi:hypothetical protein